MRAHWRSTLTAQCDRLANFFAGGALHGERDLQRRAVGLERGIRPVALVFGLKDFSSERDLGCAVAVRRFWTPAQARDVLGRLMGRNRFGENHGFARARGAPNGDFVAGKGRWMKHGESNAIAGESAQGRAVEGEVQFVGTQAKNAVPREIDITLRVAHGEVNLERLRGFSDTRCTDHGWRGSPVTVAHDDAQRAKHQSAVMADIRHFITAKHQRPRPERQWPDWGDDLVPGLCKSHGRRTYLDAHSVVIPPSTRNMLPVAKLASSLARRTMIPSTSAGVPARPRGMRETMAARDSLSPEIAVTSGVSV